MTLSTSDKHKADDTLNGWLLSPTINLVEFLGKEMVIAGITQRALMAMQGMPVLLAAVDRLVPADNEDGRQVIRRLRAFAESDAPFAKEETNNGFNTVQMHHAVATWAAVETAIEQTLVNHIQKVPNAADLILNTAASLRPNRVRTATRSDALYTIRTWEQVLDINTTVERSVHMLKAFQISLTLDKAVVRALSELAELRNVILHSGGRVDQRFVDKCPWRKDKVGNLVRVTTEEMSAYFDAAGRLAIGMIGQLVKSPFIRSA